MTENGERADARRYRAAIIDAAAAELRAGRRLQVRAVASAAGVSRSTVHRRFGNAAALEAALTRRALERAEQNIAASLERARAPLAGLREVLARLAELGAAHGMVNLDPAPLVEGSGRAADLLLPLARRILQAAELAPPPQRWLHDALCDLVVRTLRAASAESDALGAADVIFRSLTEPLDRGIVLLDRSGRLLSANDEAQVILELGSDGGRRGARVTPSDALYEDGSGAPADTHPLTLALATGESQPAAIRGHPAGEAGDLHWYVIESFALKLPLEAEPYGVVGVVSDVTDERRSQLARLRAPGTLGRHAPLILDATRALDEVPAYLLPEQLVAEARRLVQAPVALYVVDIDGSYLLRLAGTAEFPPRMRAPLALGPELAPDGLPDLRARLAAELPGVTIAPLWLRGRAVGVLLSPGGSERVLAQIARQGATAIELGNGYTDVFEAARRRKEINPAAEIQQSLLPPRIAPLGRGQVASGMLPAYEVGGDWFDYVENRNGAWLAIADASGRGVHAAALGSIGLAALRAARRNEAELQAAVQTIHETLHDAGELEFYLTAVVARWEAPHRSLSWVNAGHPAPLLLRSNGEVRELATQPDFPLGLFERERRFSVNYRRIAPGERLVLYTDGISRRPTRDGFFGRDGIIEVLRGQQGSSASAIARAIQTAVVEATTDLLRDDAAVVVFAPDPD